MKYYSIAKGKKIGVFTSWGEVSTYVTGFSGSIFKSFKTLDEAINYLMDNSVKFTDEDIHIPKAESDKPKTKTEQKTEPKTKPKTEPKTNKLKRKIDVVEDKSKKRKMDRVIVYCDGSCLHNGTSGSIGGIGIFFGDNDPRNKSEKFPLDNPTNQRAELYAAIRTLEITKDDHDIEIITDSMYTINCVTKWFMSWEKNGWKTSNGKDVKNKELIQKIIKMCRNEDKNKKIRWTHIKGHNGNYGNEKADELADMATSE
jgi:ribonuclease HI